MIGEALRRREDPRLITGRGRYVDDLHMDGTVHVAFVRSQEAHALIESVEFDSDHDGARLFTASDLGLQAPMPLQNPGPIIVQPLTASPLATDEVCYVGQPIAMVAAPTAQAAVDALDAVFVGYEPLPATVDHRHALDDSSPPVHRSSDSNLAATVGARFGDAAAVLDASERVITLDLDQHRGALASLEGRAVLAQWSDADQTLSVWTSSQSPHAARNMIASYFGLSPDDVRVVTPDVGGGFGPKALIYPEELALAALTRLLGVPVKWTERRREHFVSAAQQRGQSGTVEAAFDDSGRVTAVRARLVHDLGAFVPYGVVVPLTTLRLMSGPYAIPNLDVEIACVFTNAAPTGAIRGAGRPHATFLLERVIDSIARALDVDPAEVRRRNFVGREDFPYTVPISGSDGRPISYDGGDYHLALEMALEAANREGFAERRESSASHGLLRGLGIASYIEDTGLGPYEGARIEILPSGEVIVETGNSAQGQGHETVFTQICADQLGVPVDRVTVRGGDTGRYPHGISTVASRTATTGAGAVHVTAIELAETVRQLAASRLEAAVEDIVLQDGAAMVIGQPGTEIPLGELAAAAQPKLGGIPSPGNRLPGLSAERVLPFDGLAFTYGTHVAEVEIDPETGHTTVVSYVVVHDCGTMLNPMIVDGQIDGGVAHGLGNALSERVVYDETGQPLTTTFMDYRIITAADMPQLIKIHTETPSPNNPLGAKGAGEGGTIPAAAAVVAAIEDALGDRVAPITHHPISTQWVFEALHGPDR
ncbi:MAG TPA: xanthine dehydrogenase family protein molybdopterin-binding subunit [Acidimicrobiia bacterium]|nr:xanthine dehydrogenase family protein molybdopterin-binding subunit [Acidimicrobiia bacterium]